MAKRVGMIQQLSLPLEMIIGCIFKAADNCTLALRAIPKHSVPITNNQRSRMSRISTRLERTRNR